MQDILKKMVQCPTCRLLMESHSNEELLECCIQHLDNSNMDGIENCPNCRHEIEKHTNQELLECTLAFLK
jgi:ssDNA-binding Zn-finger/Zn-ribbon topoisomerase 1